MTINVKMTENSQSIKSYVCDVNVPVTYAGSPATIKALKSGDSIILSMSDGKVKAITAVEKTAEIKNAKITDIDIDAEKVKITISSADNLLVNLQATFYIPFEKYCDFYSFKNAFPVFSNIQRLVFRLFSLKLFCERPAVNGT